MNPSALSPSVKTLPVQLLPENRTIMVAPDDVTRKVVECRTVEALPKFGVFRWQPAGDGTFRPIYRIHETMMRAVDVEQATGVSYRTLKRLILSGLINGSQPSPGLMLVDITSYFEHQEAARDPDFWTPARRAQYSSVL